ncbi:hypothetical protein H6F76_04255 [Leptolyngbya sp. FACHB-321]|uniref:hypothetical protein n=1 Tax=Leptolyngbya sp. FACHB-321 TaxID=2692807 RepID=UPI001686E156|nr:hypothetical protein [Leptolyngbya sp. FACHB-321]MBD2034258.1 hypothetical protein [Leptolyngbya sp. FACHB-321]
MQTQFEPVPVQSLDTPTEQTRDRQTQRTVSVLDRVTGINPQRVGVQRIMRVERVVTRANRPFTETMFYISSLTLDAAAFAQRIRQHWYIENRLY